MKQGTGFREGDCEGVVAELLVLTVVNDRFFVRGVKACLKSDLNSFSASP